MFTKYILDRLSEPSSWAGIGALLLGSLGIQDHSGALGPEFYTSLGVVVTGLVALFKGDTKK